MTNKIEKTTYMTLVVTERHKSNAAPLYRWRWTEPDDDGEIGVVVVLKADGSDEKVREMRADTLADALRVIAKDFDSLESTLKEVLAGPAAHKGADGLMAPHLIKPVFDAVRALRDQGPSVGNCRVDGFCSALRFAMHEPEKFLDRAARGERFTGMHALYPVGDYGAAFAEGWQRGCEFVVVR